MTGFGVILLVGVVAYFYFNLKPAIIEQTPVVLTATSTQNQEPKKTDFAEKLPGDFPTNIPIEQGAKINQSYSLDYAVQNSSPLYFRQ